MATVSVTQDLNDVLGVNAESSLLNADLETKPLPSRESSTPSSDSLSLNGAESTDSSASTPHTLVSPPPETSDIHDLICIGFGPASLAIAIAACDKFTGSTHPRCLYLEKQPQFAWHGGMQLPGAKMQISFLKDLATPRQPTSPFTFLNYLHSVGRFTHFTNLGTFLPSRREFEAYLKWCARHFEEKNQVRYGVEVTSIDAGERENGKVTSWDISGRTSDGEISSWRARHVVVATGGRPAVPVEFKDVKNVFHSSEYIYQIPKIKRDANGRNLRFAVIGGGQSAAEIFNDLWDRFPEADVKLILKGSSLRPSDDSPFVNEIFNPERVNKIFSLPPALRASAIAQDRSTNYSVVRLELLEHLYEKLYQQRLDQPDESKWKCQILPSRAVEKAISAASDSGIHLKLGSPKEVRGLRNLDHQFTASLESQDLEEELEVDYLITATGYLRNAHESILAGTRDLLENSTEQENLVSKGLIPAARNYRALYDDAKVDKYRAGIWLQGCNESTHGLSDSLLSILAVRGGEIVESIFGKQNPTETGMKKTAA